MDEGDGATVGDGAAGAGTTDVAARCDDRPPEVHGPRASVVIAASIAVAALGVAGVLAYLGWQDRDDGVAEAPAPTAPETTVGEGPPPERGLGDLLFRRVTSEGIELRAQLSMFGAVEGIIVDDDSAGAVMPTIGVEAPAIEVPETSSAGFAPAVPAPSIPVGTASAATIVIDAAPVPATTAGNAGVAEPPPGDRRPDICTQVGDLTGWAITDEAILQGNAPWTEGAIPGLYPSMMWSPDQSALAILLQVDAAVTSVRLTGPTGTFDEMAPVDGAVVLALLVGGDVAEQGEGFSPDDVRRSFTLTAEQVGGGTMRSDWAALERGHPAWGNDPQCANIIVEPMPEPIPEPAEQLPDPGAEQPVDPAAARSEIEANFSALYGEPDEAVDRSSLIDDPYGVAETMADVRDNGFGDEADSSRVTIDELVFTSPTEAAFAYTLTTSGIDFGSQLGRARLLDGTWKISRATVCQDLNKAGAICPP